MNALCKQKIVVFISDLKFTNIFIPVYFIFIFTENIL